MWIGPPSFVHHRHAAHEIGQERVQRGLIVEPAEQRQQHEQEAVVACPRRGAAGVSAAARGMSRPTRSAGRKRSSRRRLRTSRCSARSRRARAAVAAAARSTASGFSRWVFSQSSSVGNVSRQSANRRSIASRNAVASGRVPEAASQRMQPLDLHGRPLDQALMGELVGVDVVGQAIDLARHEIDKGRAARHALVERDLGRSTAP